jgi:hypothetical protein
VEGIGSGRTPFKAKFSDGEVSRVIEVDQAAAQKILDDYLPHMSARAIVVANSSAYGGSGSAASAFSLEKDWSAHICIHELGHSHFGLADEYVVGGYSNPGVPVEPNVSADFNRPALKWAAQVAADTPLPTWREGDPAPPTDRLGAFQGAKYTDGYWRAAFDCKMNHVEHPTFCPVCSNVIAAELSRHMP